MIGGANPYVVHGNNIIYDNAILGNSAVIDASTSNSLSRRGQQFTMRADGYIDSIGHRHDYTAGNLTVGIHANVAGSPDAPGAQLAVSTKQASGTSGYEITTHALTSALFLAKGTKFWVVWKPEDGSAYAIQFHNLYGVSAIRNGGLEAGLPNPFGAVTTGIDSFTAYCNVRYDPATYNDILNEDFTNWTASNVPDGWALNFTPDANNKVEENANGMRLLCNSVVSTEITREILTNGQEYNYALETYSYATGWIYLTAGTNLMNTRYAGIRTTNHTAGSTIVRLRKAATNVDMVIRSLKIWQ